MGYNATVVVLMDRLNEIENDPYFGKKLCDAIRYRAAYGPRGIDQRGIPYVPGQTDVVSVEHADVAQVVIVGANCGQMVGRGRWSLKPEEILKHVLKELKEEKAKST